MLVSSFPEFVSATISAEVFVLLILMTSIVAALDPVFSRSNWMAFEEPSTSATALPLT